MTRLTMLALVAVLSCSSNGSTTKTPSSPAKGPASTEAPKSGGALEPDQVASYFQDGAAAEAAEHYALDDWSGALEKFKAALAQTEDQQQQHRIELMIAVTALATDANAEAAPLFEAAIERFPLLEDWLRYMAARARYGSGDADKALEHARSIERDSVYHAKATLLMGDILRVRSDHAATEKVYRDYLDDEDNGQQRAEARFRLAEALEAQGKLKEAAENYRRIDIYAPLSAFAEPAQDKLDAIVPRLPASERPKILDRSTEEQVAHAMVYHDNMRNDVAADLFAKILETKDLSSEELCTIQFHHGNCYWKLRNRTKSAPIFEKAIKACDKTDNVELQVKSKYQAGRSYGKLDEPDNAISRFGLIEKEHADHSYADDAALRAAEEYEEKGDEEKMIEILSRVPDKYPDGDMKAVAVWRVAWQAYQSKNFDKAIVWLKKQIEVEPIATHWERTGQPQYWLGRIYAAQGKADDAIAAYEEAIRKYPLSYYALLALNRLREKWPERFESIKAEVAEPPADPSEGAFAFKPREVYQTDGFQRALMFMRLGLMTSAQAELQALDFGIPSGRDQITEPDAIDRTWAVVFLLHHAGDHSRAIWPTRWHVLDYKRHWPVGGWRDRWEVAYPKAWWQLLDKWAKKRGHPTELQIAFVREESGFNPILESWANAIGLTQMIFPTAKRFGKGTGIAITRENLRDPEKNVIIGSNFLSFLYNKWNGRIGLIVPSYNTGENRVARWLRERPGQPQDVFGENIPLDEPRRYNKRVTESFFVYSYLKDGTIPEMPN